jgi:hypothetical protein
MKISRIYNLGKTQAELDFVDIDVDGDTALFIDPFFLNKRNDNWSISATQTVRNFFQTLIDLIRDNQISAAKLLFRHLHEPNATCLGLSQGNPQGRGVGIEDTDRIFDSIIRSRAIQTGLIQDLEDNHLFVENFGKDKLSDMTTNIIRKHLIEYTVSQCVLNNISLTENVPSGFYWNRYTREWESEYTTLLIVGQKKILLVPKAIVSFCSDYTPQQYYQHFVLNFLQNEHLELNSSLVQKRVDGTRYVTKKDIKEDEATKYSKEFLREFTKKHPGVLQNFKLETEPKSLNANTFGDLNVGAVAAILVRTLNDISSGNEAATRYHRLIVGILELLFYPHLIYPQLEREIHEGRKRIDIVFDNASRDGVFRRLSENMRLPCQYIFIECKNYSSDPTNPELDQLSGRFSVNRGKVGFLLCRTIDNFDLFIARCRDTYRDDRGLIIPLVDADIITMLENIINHNFTFFDGFVSERIRSITIN